MLLKSTGECYWPTTLSLLAVSTENGTELSYKYSNSEVVGRILFEGLNVSSVSACGDTFLKCPIFQVSASNNITAVVLPLGENFGVATFDSGGFREKHVISIVSLDLECEITTMFLSPLTPSNLLTQLLGICRYQGTEGDLLDKVLINLNLVNLTESILLSKQFSPCEVVDPGELVFFKSSTFLRGVLVFADQGGILFQRYNQDCSDYEDFSGCASSVERFVSISEEKQAIYCSTGETYVLDIAENSGPPPFVRSEDGYVMFCSSEIIANYKNNELTLRSLDRTALGNSTELPYDDEDVIGGDCIPVAGQFFSVLQLRNGTVVVANLNQSRSSDLGAYSVPPRLFGRSLLLANSTHSVVYNIVRGDFVDVLSGKFSLGLVINDLDVRVPCPASTSMPLPLPLPTTSMPLPPTSIPATSVSVPTSAITSTPFATTSFSDASLSEGKIAGIVVGAVVGTVVVVMGVLIIICLLSRAYICVK